MELADLRLVTTLARSESLSAAARMLNVTTSALSMRLKKLEETLGVLLATRDARNMSLTADGARLAREAEGLLAAIDALPDTFRDETARLAGHIRIAAPFGFGRVHVAPLLARFARENPEIRLQLDLLETPWPHSHDADIVIQIGTVRDTSWTARPLLANERWLCASPGYVAARGYPREPREILDHDCICIRENDEDVTLWRVRRRRAQAGARHSTPLALRVVAAYSTNDGSVARRWAEDGLGLVLRSQWDVADAVASGKLVRLLGGWDFGSAPVTALVPSRKGRSSRVQALLDYLGANLGAINAGTDSR